MPADSEYPFIKGWLRPDNKYPFIRRSQWPPEKSSK